MVDTLVLEASVARRRSSSLLWGTKFMRGSYSGNTLAFQANAESSILLPRSNFLT